MFDRLELLIGKEYLNKIKEKHIVVLGLGGVGGYVVESLIRSGVEHITIIDNDTIDITNLRIIVEFVFHKYSNVPKKYFQIQP